MKVPIPLVACLALVPHTGRAVEAESFEYRPVTQADLEKVEEDWRSRDLSAQNVRIIEDEEIEDGRVLIVRHEIDSRAHFGAIVLPDVEDLSTAPVAVLPDGLSQLDPTIDVEVKINKYREHESADGYIKIIPSFRGRSMAYKGNGWFSRGDFCDAWDGATDDSIAMLNAAEEILPQADFDSVLVYGGSRGGNTALLMAVRDPRVHTVITIAAPVDFYRQSWQIEGIDQYRCQFFDGRDETAARHDMLASSPLFFDPAEGLQRAVIHHDEGDDIVPVWNAREMSAHLESHSVDVTTHIYPTEGHGHLVAEDSFWDNTNATLREYAERVAEGR